MQMKEFQKKVEKALREYAGEKKEVRFHQVRKNNGILLCGVSCYERGSNLTPTVYLEEYLSRYKEGESFGALMEEIIRVFEGSTLKESFALEDFQCWEKARERIVYKLINSAKNSELLSEIPSIPFLDLSIVFYYLLGEDSRAQATILIYNKHIEEWGVSAEELYACAHGNSRRLLPGIIQDMESLMREIFLENARRKMIEHGGDGEDMRCADLMAEEMLSVAMEGREDVPMYVLSNKRRYFGAACLLYPGILTDFAKELGCDLYILPSSVHEVILLPDNGPDESGKLREMVREVNLSQVPAEEVLSDELYYYERDTDTLRRLDADELCEEADGELMSVG